MDVTYRIDWCEDFDLKGLHTATFAFEEPAKQYFAKVRKKYPNADVVTTVLDIAGNVLKVKEFNHGKAENFNRWNQRRVHLVRYDIEWKTEDPNYIFHDYSFDDANDIILKSIGTDGYGTKWIYLLRPCMSEEQIEGFEPPIPQELSMRTTY
jgi:hypothetical protein